MKIWLYYAKAGGGHKAPAEALGREIAKFYPQTEIKLVDLAEKAVFFIRFTLEGGYSLLIHNFNLLYVLLYKVSCLRPIMAIEYKLGEWFMKASIKSRLVVDSPDGIVATHFLTSPIRSALRELKKNIPLVVVVTDPYSAPPIWFYYLDQHYIVFSDAARSVALAAGVPATNILVMPQVINHQVNSYSAEKIAEIKQKNGLSPNKKTVLMIGGAYGLPKGDKVLSAMINKQVDANIVVVCGHNERAVEKMRVAAGSASNVKVLGYVQNVPELMAASDLVISKAGAGVVWETVLNRKPLLITNYVYGQEEGTKDFIVKNGLGWYLPEPDKAVDMVERVLFGLEDSSKISEKFDFRSGNEEIAHYAVRWITSVRP